MVCSLKKEPEERGDLRSLMGHPFIVRSKEESVDFAAWVQEARRKPDPPPS